MSIEVNE